MIVVAIVGILSTLSLHDALPILIRSKVSELEAALAACKTSVAEYASSHGSAPADTAASGCSTLATQYVLSGVSVNNGTITGTTTGIGAATDVTLTLTPSPTTSADITKWTGTYLAPSPSKYVPSSFR